VILLVPSKKKFSLVKPGWPPISSFTSQLQIAKNSVSCIVHLKSEQA